VTPLSPLHIHIHIHTHIHIHMHITSRTSRIRIYMHTQLREVNHALVQEIEMARNVFAGRVNALSQLHAVEVLTKQQLLEQRVCACVCMCVCMCVCFCV